MVNWSLFKRGTLHYVNRWNLCLKTILTNVVTDIIDECSLIDPNCSIHTLFPNGFTTASFDIVIRGEGFEVTCGRRLVRGWFPYNPLAAEFGKNYDVLVSINADDLGIQKRLVNVIQVRREF